MTTNTMILVPSQVIPEKCFIENTEYAEKSAFCQQFYLSPALKIGVNIGAFIAIALLVYVFISISCNFVASLRSYLS